MEAFLSQAWREKRLVLLMGMGFPKPTAARPDVSETWWAREDSNLQPDRYERSALTIELRARCVRARAAPPAPPYNASPRAAIAPRPARRMHRTWAGESRGKSASGDRRE